MPTSSPSAAGFSPPSFLRLAGHPLRWRLLTELSGSDRRVSELTRLLGRPQSLISYHLGRLRADRLVAPRRSSADGRDAYYRLDLERCGELLTATGAELHPGLRLAAQIPPPPAGATLELPPVRVLFLCTGNSARSQIAEALIEQLGHGAVQAFSAGSHPKPLHENALLVMRRRGVDVAGRRSKHLDELADQDFEYVISLCDRVREVCPEFPGHPEVVHWSIPDPAREGEGDTTSLPAFERTADELAVRITFLLARIRSVPRAKER